MPPSKPWCSIGTKWTHHFGVPRLRGGFTVTFFDHFIIWGWFNFVKPQFVSQLGGSPSCDNSKWQFQAVYQLGLVHHKDGPNAASGQHCRKWWPKSFCWYLGAPRSACINPCCLTPNASLAALGSWFHYEFGSNLHADLNMFGSNMEGGIPPVSINTCFNLNQFIIIIFGNLSTGGCLNECLTFFLRHGIAGFQIPRQTHCLDEPFQKPSTKQWPTQWLMSCEALRS